MSGTELARARREMWDVFGVPIEALAEFERLVRADERAKVEKEVRAETFENGAW